MRKTKIAQKSFREAQQRARGGKARRSSRLSSSNLPPLIEGENNPDDDEEEDEFNEEKEDNEEKEEENEGKEEKEYKLQVLREEKKDKERELLRNKDVEESGDELTDVELDQSSEDEEEENVSSTFITTPKEEGVIKKEEKIEQKKVIVPQDEKKVEEKKEVHVMHAHHTLLTLSPSTIARSLKPIIEQEREKKEMGEFSSSWDSDEVRNEKMRIKRMQELSDCRSDKENNFKSSIHVLIITCNKYKDERIKDISESIDRDGGGLLDVFSNDFYSKIDEDNARLVKNPTKSELINSFENLAKECDENSNIIIYLACHGGRINRGFKSKGNYLFVHDSIYGSKSEITSSSFSTAEIVSLLKNVKGGKKTLFLDVCHTKKPRSSLAALKQNVINSKTLRIKSDFYDDVFTQSGYDNMIVACDVSVSIEEKSLYGKLYGLFCGSIISAMKGGAFKKNFDFIAMKEIWKYVESEMKELSSQLTEKQTPLLFGDPKMDYIACLNPSPPYKIEGIAKMKKNDHYYLTITWPKLEFDGAAPVNGYEVQFRGVGRGDGSEWKVINSRVEENHYKVPHLMQGISYRFRICALNKYGKGIPSHQSDKMSLVSKHQDSSLNVIMSNALQIEIKKGINGYVKLMREYKIYGFIQLNCVRALVAFAVRREISISASLEVMKLTITAMTTFSWSAQLQLEGIYLLGHLLKQHDILKEFVKLKGEAIMYEAEKLFDREESIILAIKWFKRELPHRHLEMSKEDEEAPDLAEEEEKVEEEEKAVTDLSNSSVIEKYKAAAEIVNKTLAGIITQCTEGMSISSICTFGDKLIEGQCASVFKTKKLDKGIAFPTCVSVNEVVSHYSPLKEEKTKTLVKGDIVKIDLGCHIDGFIAVVAHTVVVGITDLEGPLGDIMKAAHTISEVAHKLVRPGNTNAQVTEAITEVAKTFGVNVVQGVLSHQMKQYVIDANKVILMRSDPEQKVEEYTFESNEVFAIDVVLSSGEGKPKESETKTTVFKRAIDKTYNLKMKASRAVFNEVNKKYPTLPFSLRNIEDEKTARLGVSEMLKHDMLIPYPVLHEKAGDLVSHFKFTLLLLPSGTDRVTGAGLYDATKIKSDKEPTETTKAILALSSKTKKKKNKKNKGEAKEEEGEEKA